jgi:hypothetical protein
MLEGNEGNFMVLGWERQLSVLLLETASLMVQRTWLLILYVPPPNVQSTINNCRHYNRYTGTGFKDDGSFVLVAVAAAAAYGKLYHSSINCNCSLVTRHTCQILKISQQNNLHHLMMTPSPLTTAAKQVMPPLNWSEMTTIYHWMSCWRASTSRGRYDHDIYAAEGSNYLPLARYHGCQWVLFISTCFVHQSPVKLQKSLQHLLCLSGT